LYIQGFYDDAIAEFRDFVKAYGKDPRAPKAQLYIATAYFNQKQPEKALIEYDLAIQNYPDSDTKCNALYKKGQTLAELKKTAEARLIYQSVVNGCPNTEESNFAATELKKLAPAAGRGARGNN
jgi:tol-pal system protein YbgF